MSGKSKLRLGDGTVLLVDQEALHTWLVDEKATVQAPGAHDWRPLKEVVAQARRKANSGTGADDGVPIIPFKALPPDEAPRRNPLAPPPSTSELPALRFAETPEEEDEWDEGEVYGGQSASGVAWKWVKRVVLVTGLVALGLVAATTWESWFPRLGELGAMALGEIDKRVRPERPTTPNAEEEQQRQLKEGLEAATQQLPQLAPETIQLVMSGSVVGVLDPPEVFRRAYAAAERGRPSLTPEETQELTTLEEAAVAPLSRDERERIREYDRVRALRVTLPFEDREVLGLLARGARALPAPDRERLQALSGKAVAAGLETVASPAALPVASP